MAFKDSSASGYVNSIDGRLGLADRRPTHTVSAHRRVATQRGRGTVIVPTFVGWRAASDAARIAAFSDEASTVRIARSKASSFDPWFRRGDCAHSGATLGQRFEVRGEVAQRLRLPADAVAREGGSLGGHFQNRFD
jgi:hypothetical protein